MLVGVVACVALQVDVSREAGEEGEEGKATVQPSSEPEDEVAEDVEEEEEEGEEQLREGLGALREARVGKREALVGALAGAQQPPPLLEDNNVRVDGDRRLTLCATSDCIAIVDTGTSFIGVPSRKLPMLLNFITR